jgi:hypothetical protein
MDLHLLQANPPSWVGLRKSSALWQPWISSASKWTKGPYLRKSLLDLHLGQDVGWLYLQYDTFLSGRSPWVFVLADILLGKLVNVCVGAFECL